MDTAQEMAHIGSIGHIIESRIHLIAVFQNTTLKAKACSRMVWEIKCSPTFQMEVGTDNQFTFMSPRRTHSVSHR